MSSEEISLYVQVVPVRRSLDTKWQSVFEPSKSGCALVFNTLVTHPRGCVLQNKGIFFFDKTKQNKKNPTRFTHSHFETLKGMLNAAAYFFFVVFLTVAARLRVLTEVLKRRRDVGQQQCKLTERLLVM